MGASQGKAGLAAACAAVARLAPSQLGGVTVVNSEGSSSHRSSEALFAGLGARRPAACVLTMGTDDTLILGHRGRVEVVIEVQGKPTHSTRGGAGSPIPVVEDVLRRIRELDLDGASHPLLGAATVLPYRLVCGSVAPHTIPRHCTIVLDRRTLPGDKTEAIVDQIAQALAGLPVEVSAGPVMLPALVDERTPIVASIQAAAQSVLGHALPVTCAPWTFDMGYACSQGVPTVMYGPSTSDTAGDEVLGEDFVSERAVTDAIGVHEG